MERHQEGFIFPVDVASLHFPVVREKREDAPCIFWMYPATTLGGEDTHAYANVSLPSLPDASFLNPPITAHRIPSQNHKLPQRHPAVLKKQILGLTIKI